MAEKSMETKKESGVKRISIEDWKKKATELYGPDIKKWKFRCANCGNIQSISDFDGIEIDPSTVVFFSCIGRWKEQIGCDWTLGGLFQMHKTEVIDSEGKAHPVFEFADD